MLDARTLPIFCALLGDPLPDTGPLRTLAELLEEDRTTPPDDSGTRVARLPDASVQLVDTAIEGARPVKSMPVP